MVIVMLVTAEVTARSFVKDFANFVAEQGHEVYVIADGVQPSRIVRGTGAVNQVSVHMVREPSLLQDFKSLFLLRRALKEINPDVITYATPKASLLGSFASFSLRIPNRIYQLWGLRLETSVGFSRQVLIVLEFLTSVFSSRILANSKSLSKVYKTMRLSGGKSVDVVGFGSSHGVDIEKFSAHRELPELSPKLRNQLLQDSPQIVIGFVGRIQEDKGIDTLVEAMGILIAEGFRPKLLLVGKNEGADSAINDEINEFVVKAGYAIDPRPFYTAMDVLVLPSRREGFPNVVLEAASMSVPAVVSNATGVIDSVIHETTGLIFEVGNAVSLADALKKFIIDPELLVELGANARKRVVSNYSNTTVWNQTLEYLLAQRNG